MRLTAFSDFERAQPLAHLCAWAGRCGSCLDDRGGDEIAVLGLAFVAGANENSRSRDFFSTGTSRPPPPGQGRKMPRTLGALLGDDLDDAARVAVQIVAGLERLDPHERAVADPRHGRAAAAACGAARRRGSWGRVRAPRASHSAGSATSSPSRSRALMSAEHHRRQLPRLVDALARGGRARLRLRAPSASASARCGRRPGC